MTIRASYRWQDDGSAMILDVLFLDKSLVRDGSRHVTFTFPYSDKDSRHDVYEKAFKKTFG